jgi:hypothetical protein
MKVRIQLVIETGGAAPVTTDIAQIERSALSGDTLGLHLAEAKSILANLQQALVATHVEEALDAAGVCAQCQAPLRCKGHHDIVFRTVFGKLTLPSPRLYRCSCCAGDPEASATPRSFSPLAEALPERTSPELQYLQSKYAALMSYGLTLKVLDEILPLGHQPAIASIRQSLQRVSDRIEGSRVREQPAADGPAVTAEPVIAPPSPVKAIGIDGGYVRAHDAKSPQEGWFEVIVGKSVRDDGDGRSFAYVHRLESKPWERMQRFVEEEGLKPDQPVIFISDGGDTVRHAQTGFGPHREYVLDWFHIGMRFQNLTQLAKGLEEADDSPKRESILKDIDGAKWYLWHGCPHRAMQRLESLTYDVYAMPDGATKTKLAAKLGECQTYIENNQDFIVNYGDRFRHGEPIASGFVESAVNQVIAKRFVKKQQMRWSDCNAHRLLQVRTAVLNDELRKHFEAWYPGIAANDPCAKMAA